MSLEAVGSVSQGRLGAVVVKRLEFPPPPARFYMGSYALVVLGVLVMGIAAFMLMEARSMSVSLMPGVLCAVCGIPFIALGAFLLSRRAALRCALTLHEQGVVVSRKGNDEAIPYTQVQDVSLKEEQKLDNGKHAGVLRTLSFTWTGGKSRVVQFASPDVDDVFGPSLSQILRKLADTAEARLKTGASLEGKGWTLDTHGLHVKGQPPVRLVELAGVGMFEDKVSFWRAGEEMPFFSVPDSSSNARLLGILSQRQLADRERPMAGPLGRILFQRQLGMVGQVISGIMGALLIVGGGIAAFGLGMAGSILGVALTLLGCWGVGALCVSMVIGRFRVHELGVTQRTLFGDRTLRYSELTSFQFGATRNYYNGAYTGTTLNMSFTPGPGAKGITHNQTVRGTDSDLDSLREQVSGMVAGLLLERFKQGEEIRWGPTARFTKNGLVVQESKLFGKGAERLAPYNGGLRYSIEQGSLNLFIGQENKAAMTVECAADNFYPGLQILGVLCSQAGDSQRVAG